MIPGLDFHPSLSALLQSELAGNRLMLDFAGDAWRRQVAAFDDQQPFHCLIGAEGGLSPDEIKLAQAHEFAGIYLGPRVLRMETAAISITSLIQHYFGDLG